MNIHNIIFNDTRLRNKEVNVIDLLRNNPQINTHEELHALIDQTAAATGKFTLEEIAENMWGKSTINFNSCFSFVKDLFLIKTLHGFNMENKALHWLRQSDKRFTWDLSTEELDNKFNVDVIGVNEEETIYIQVKPESYKYTDSKTKKINESKEKSLDHKIHFLYYDYLNNFSF